jgi:two-component system, chemotaxis family, chemotaxis protein CheY
MSKYESPILVVDDDQAILTTVAEILHLEGYPVTTAANGAEALDAIQRERPSLVLLDMRMPVVDGWEFTRKLREQGQNLPILVMTAAQDAGRWADEIGAQGYLAKPFDLSDLLDSVSRLRDRGSGAQRSHDIEGAGEPRANGTNGYAHPPAVPLPGVTTHRRHAS